MRIGIFDPYLDTLSGGEKYMLSIASCLSSKHSIFIFWDKKMEVEIKQGILRKLGMDLSNIKFYKNIFSPHVSFLSRFIESRKFDAIVYLSDGSIPFIGTKLYIHFQFPIEWINGKSLKTKFKLLFVKKIFCNSYFTKFFVDKKLNIESQVLYPPVDINKVINVKKENVILSVGRLDVDKHENNYKKQDVMIKVLKKMIDEGLKDWKLILVIGVRSEDKNKLYKLEEMVKGYPIEIIENPSSQILWNCYSMAKIYWHATGFDENLEKYPEKAEHFGISTVEAMGAGSVPVVINAGGQKEIVQDGKNGYLWNTLEDCKKRTNDLIEDERLWKKMSNNAQERANKFIGERFCRELKEIIR
ncbi:MAG: glycosyltransferase [Candidatus Levybacteria bacterium]|nr:glycosyltransferase [Candidatus Levybacteria bacterium]